MNEREKLIELLHKITPAPMADGWQPSISCCVGIFADAILADGWIKPKFKVGQEVWIIKRHKALKTTIESIELISYNVKSTDLQITEMFQKHKIAIEGGEFDECDIFYTEAEAQKTLTNSEI